MCIIIGGMGEDKRIDMLDWRIIYLPMSLGGLGIRKVSTFN